MSLNGVNLDWANWALAMRWEQLLFMHWPLPSNELQPLLPPGVRVDTFGGRAWVGVVPFTMSRVRLRWTPSVPGVSHFPELNVRTYVTVRGVPGVWFFSLEAANPLAVRVARVGFHLPYFTARMRASQRRGEVQFESRRTHRGAAPAAFAARYRRLAGPLEVDPALTHFLTERYALYSVSAERRLYRAEISHKPWPLEPAEVSFARSPDEMTRPLGLRLPETPPLLHYAERLEVVAGLPYRV